MAILSVINIPAFIIVGDGSSTSVDINVNKFGTFPSLPQSINLVGVNTAEEVPVTVSGTLTDGVIVTLTFEAALTSGATYSVYISLNCGTF
jgi:hypothetical protein